MQTILKRYDQITTMLSGKLPEGAALLFLRITLAGVFWRSGRTKIEDGSWFTLSVNALYQFGEEPFNNLPLLPAEIAAQLTAFFEHLFPALLVIGLFTRFSGLALLGMTLVIQIFIFPDAWWPVHMLWVAMQLMLIVRGGGVVSLDHILARRRT